MPLTEPPPRAMAPSPSTDEPLVRLRGLGMQYALGAQVLQVLDELSLDIARGELVVLQGVSGSGKSTLLHLLGGIESPTRGSIDVAGIRIGALSADAAAAFRAREVGFVFQFFNLIPTLTALENVVCALEPLGGTRSSREQLARAALAAVGLEAQIDQYPSRLSGGQQQRVAIARAVVKKPGLLLADEPTGALDQGTARQVMELLRSLCREHGCATLIATHDAMVCGYADRVLRLEGGRLQTLERA